MAYKKMVPHVKAAWLTALRSGSYIQGRGFLREGDTFCCLGVLCDLGDKSAESWAPDGFEAVFTFYEKSQYLPRCVRSAARVSEVVSKRLAEMNDRGKDFDEIADWIEENL